MNAHKFINSSNCTQIFSDTLRVVVVVIIPPLCRDGGMAQMTIQVHAVNLIELG